MNRKNNTQLLLVSLFSFFLFLHAGQASGSAEKEFVWKAGVARMIITPKSPVWMAGYSSRTSPSEGTLHDLWAKALVLEDARGTRSLLITLDLLAVSKEFSDDLRTEIKRRYGFDYSQIILSTSHTHSGPVISRALKYIYPMEQEDWECVDQYTAELREGLLELVGESLKELHTVKVYTGNGITRFQVNRRNNRENSLQAATELKGPNDYAVPVIKVEGHENQVLAVVFGYACHPTTLSINKFSGDYAGFAQVELENLYPGTTAMFFQGAGGDQNPLPRRTIPLATQYGKQLAATVERILSEEMNAQESRLITQYDEIELLFDDPLPREELQQIAAGTDYQARWATGMLQELNTRGSLVRSYPYPIGFWQIGEQKLFILGGESVIAYSLRLKERYGEQIFVMSYANDVMGYIPSEVVLDEGGYEGDTSQRVYGLPAKWDRSVESRILTGIEKLVSAKR